LQTATCQELESYLKQAYQENEKLRATNVGLNQSYQELLKRYSDLVGQNEDIVESSVQRQRNLQSELSSERQDVQARQQYLQELERQIERKENELSRMERNYDREVTVRDQQIAQLRSELSRQNQEMNRLNASLNNNLSTLMGNELSMREQDGRIYLSLSQELLFRTGSSRIDREGKAAIKQVAQALKENPDVEVLVEGHTDNTGSATTNWELSTDRAVAVVQELTRNGISPDRLIAAGRGEYNPIANNSSESGRARNRRTEIILSPKMNALNDIMYRR